MPDNPRASTIRAKPPPEVPVMDLTPAYEAPIAILIAAISSSACSITTPVDTPCLDRYSIIGVAGDMGYAL